MAPIKVTSRQLAHEANWRKSRVYGRNLLVCATIAVLVAMLLPFLASGLTSSEIQPVMHDSATMYALNCHYRYVFSSSDVKLAPLEADASRVEKGRCPRTVEEARRKSVRD